MSLGSSTIIILLYVVGYLKVFIVFYRPPFPLLSGWWYWVGWLSDLPSVGFLWSFGRLASLRVVVFYGCIRSAAFTTILMPVYAWDHSAVTNR